MRRMMFIFLLVLGACHKDETVSGYATPGQVWRLTELNNVPFGARATLTFPKQNKIAGKGACNSFQGSQSAPYPWFEARDIITTKMICPAMATETAFLVALSQMTLVEVAGKTLILSDDTGQEMVFSSRAN